MSIRDRYEPQVEMFRRVWYSYRMEDKYTYILEQESIGVPIVQIAKDLKISLSSVNYHRKKPQYAQDLNTLKLELSNRPKMSLQDRAEAMLQKVITAMEEEMDKADTNMKIIGMTEKLKDLIIVVGKPKQERDLGVVHVTGLLSRDAFNTGQGEEETKEEPKDLIIPTFSEADPSMPEQSVGNLPLPERSDGPLSSSEARSINEFNSVEHPCSLSEAGESPEGAKPQGSLFSPGGVETPTHECDNQNNPQPDTEDNPFEIDLEVLF